MRRGAVIVPQTTSSLDKAAQVIARGGVIAFRTDTFYGLGADPFNHSAIQKIKALKGREDGKPILVLISDSDRLERLFTSETATSNLLKRKLWPGPLTIIGPASSELPGELTADTKTVGVRLPDDDKVRALVRHCGGALTATSANPSGMPPARTAGDVEGYFGERIDLIVDGGPTTTDQPSTVVDATRDEMKVVRHGVLPWHLIRESLE